MCGGTSVTTLEHVLPKADYPEFAVLSFNLVPCCDGCQRRRSNKGKNQAFIHPYFDRSLLTALSLEIQFTPPFSVVIFELIANGVVGHELERTKKHLENSVPPLLLRRHMRRLWHKWHARFYGHSLSDLVTRLNHDLHSEQRDAPNSWESAFLRGLLRDTRAQTWMHQTEPG